MQIGPLKELLGERENECLELSESVGNLERVLEDFHLQQESLANLEILRLKKEVEAAGKEREEAMKRKEEVEVRNSPGNNT